MGVILSSKIIKTRLHSWMKSLCCEDWKLRKLMTHFEAIQRAELCETCQKGHSWPRQSVSGWRGAAGLSGLGENNQKAEKAPGKNKLLTQAQLSSSQTCKECRPTGKHPHAKAPKGHDFHDWANPSNTQDSNSGRDSAAPLNCSWTQSLAINKQGRFHQALAFISVLLCIVESYWLVSRLASSPPPPHLGPLHRLAIDMMHVNNQLLLIFLHEAATFFILNGKCWGNGNKKLQATICCACRVNSNWKPYLWLSSGFTTLATVQWRVPQLKC